MTLTSKKAMLEEKPVCFFSCRVHCGETPGSFMLQGVIDMLCDFENPQTKVLLDNYIFKIIPVLNPDGVARGYWRMDTLGQNLNRFYKEPTLEHHPTIYFAKNKVLEIFKEGNLKMYVDFHAHCTKRGCFIFGNTCNDADAQFEAMLIPKLMSLNCVNFDFSECNFADEKLNIKDKKGDSRDGSGRAVIFRETNSNPLTYTFEANYATGLRINTLQTRFDLLNQKKIVKEDSIIQDTSSQLYRGKKVPIFNQDIFLDVGQSLLVSLLDYDGINPISRLIKKKGETLQEALDKIRAYFKKQEEKPSIGAIKKKLGVGKKKAKFAKKLDQIELVLKEDEQTALAQQLDELDIKK